VAIFGVQGWRWDEAREVCVRVFALDADAAGGKRVAVLKPAAYGGTKM
jgi:hypothetical protein